MDKIFELKITWRDAALLICAGAVILLLVLGISFWFLFPYFNNPNGLNILFSLTLLGIALMTGVIFFFGFLIYFASLLIYSGIKDSIFVLKYGGILYRLDQKGITYQEGWLLKTKVWSEISDVGLFKQESKKSSIVYNYQIKFSDDLPHTFDLRGKYPTKDFNQKVEEFWLNYIYEEPSLKR